MAKIIFNEEEIEMLKTACDTILKNSGIIRIKEIAALLEKLNQQENDYLSLEMKLIQQLCDTSLKTMGLIAIKNVISLLNKTIEINK